MAEISKLNGYALKDAVARGDIAGIKDGTIPVHSADHATSAEHARYCDSGG